MVTEITITVVTLPFLSVASKQGDEFFEVLNNCSIHLDEILELISQKGINYAKYIQLISKHRPNANINELISLYRAAAKLETRKLNASVNSLDSEITQNVKNYRNLLGDLSQQGNVGYANIEILGVSKEIYSFSSFDTIDEAVEFSANANKLNKINAWKPENQVFETFEINFPRDVDTEYKILSEVSKQIGNKPSISGKIKLYTEFKCCDSCSDVIAQFISKYPNIQIEVIYSGHRLL